MTRADIIAKLEDLAENGGSIAELNACKALLALPEFQAVDEGAGDPFRDLDGDELAPRRKRVA
jgi:hypothetical protein